MEATIDQFLSVLRFNHYYMYSYFHKVWIVFVNVALNHSSETS